MSFKTLAVLAALLPVFLCSPVIRQIAQNDLHPALLNLNAQWPVQNVPRTNISSTFGPRILVSGNRYDFHRGCDISAGTGTPILAALGGKLYGTRTYSGGGKTVILDHVVSVRFHGQTRTRLSTFYMHMDSFHTDIENGSKGKVVNKGDVIGYVGMTGEAVSPHLHFEARLGSRCSLQFQIEEKKCVVGYDPHVHPLYLFEEPGATEGITLSLDSAVTGAQDGEVSLSAPDEYPVANRYTLQVVRVGGAVEDLAVLDLTLREGFDATTTTKLDTQNKNFPYLEPNSFGRSATEWTMSYMIPSGFMSKDVGETWKLVVENVFEDTVEITVAQASDSW